MNRRTRKGATDGRLLSLILLPALLGLLPSTLAKPESIAMPKAAPDFRKPNSGKSAQDSIGSSVINSSDFAGSTFRVRTPAPSVVGLPQDGSIPLQGQATRTDLAPLQGQASSNALRAGIAKTSPGQAAESKTVPPEAFRAWIEKAHPQFSLSAMRNSPRDLLEVKGIYDNSGKTLESLGIPFEHIRTGALRERSLSGVKVMVIDCPGRVPRESFQKIRDWVAQGGYLLSTDWSGDNAIQPIFPGYIEWTGKKNRDSIYPSELTYTDPALATNLITNSTWKMDIECHPVRAIRQDVRVLARSSQLAAEDPASQGALGVVFPFGRGYVMHLVGHFDNNTALPNRIADAAPVIRISMRQALATNFVVAGLTGRKIPIR